MNILQVSFKNPFEDIGGAEAVILNLCENIGSMDKTKVDIICCSKNKNSVKKTPYGELINFNQTFKGIDSFSTIINKIVYNLKLNDYIKKNHNKYDIIHFHGDNGFSSILNQLNIITTFHGFSYDKYKKFNFIKRLITYYGSSVYEFNNLKSKEIVAVSNHVKKQISKYTNKKINVIYNGINTKLYKPASLLEKNEIRKRFGIKNEKIVLCFGHDSYRKGLDISIKILDDLNMRNVKLYVLGIDKKDANIDKENVVFLGKIFGDKKIEIMKISDAFIAPSRYEGFSVAVLEAMSCGIPTIISNNTNVGEIIKNNEAIVINSLDYKKYSFYLKKILSDNKLKLKMSRYSRRLMLKYDWNVIAKKYQAVYKKMLNNTLIK